MKPGSALAESQRVNIKLLPASQPLTWLASGWQDLVRCPGPALLHGAALALFGAVLLWAARGEFWLLAGAFSGFLLVAPVLATGLYAISRALSRGEPAGLRTASMPGGRAMGRWSRSACCSRWPAPAGC
jgi:uncharacterized membrane protein